jgi:cell division protein FtsL
MSGRNKNIQPKQRPGKPVRSAPSRFLLLLCVGLISCLAYLWGQNQTLSAARRVEDLTQAKEALQRSVDRLALEMAGRHSSERVIELARERLGLEFPAEPIQTLAVAPAASGRGPSVWTYMENALVMAVEGMQQHLSPSADAREAAPPDTTGGN